MHFVHVLACVALAVSSFAAVGAEKRGRELPEPHAAPAKAGRDLLGTRVPEWQVSGWLNSEPLSLEGLRGKVVLVRWWTAPGCPFCAASAEGLTRLWEEYREQGLVVIGLYHHKSEEAFSHEHVAREAKRLGFGFPVAVDDDWRTLSSWWLDGRGRAWTSVTFLLGRDGTIRHVHGGGAYWPGEAGYAALEQAVREALGVKKEAAAPGEK